MWLVYPLSLLRKHGTNLQLIEDIIDVRFQRVASEGSVTTRLKRKASPHAQNGSQIQVFAPVEVFHEAYHPLDKAVLPDR